MSGYSEGGASTTKRSLRSWTPHHGSAKQDIDEHLPILRSRAADLVLNDPVGAAIVQTLTTGVIGSGLKLFPRIKAEDVGLSPEQVRLWSRNVKREFNLWASNPNHVDFFRRNNFSAIQAVAFRAMLTDGDSFILFRRRQPSTLSPYSLRLQVVDALRVSNPLSNVGTQTEMLFGANRIIRGIEVDKGGALVAIHISNRLWNETDLLQPELTWQRVQWFGTESGMPNVLHICKDQSPGQFRGVPVLAPVIESLKQVSRYSDAELSAAIIRSFFALFFTKERNNFNLNMINENDAVAPDFKVGSPSVTDLPPGVSVQSVDTAKQQSAFSDFTLTYLKSICAAVNVPYEVVLKTFNSSYSASRAALLQAEEEFRQRRQAFITDFCAPVYEQFLTEAIALGKIEAPGFFTDPLKRQAYLSAEWLCEQNHSLDAVKEVNAAKLRLELGLSTREIEVANLSGRDFDDIKDQLEADTFAPTSS